MLTQLFRGGKFSVSANQYNLPVSAISFGSLKCLSNGTYYLDSIIYQSALYSRRNQDGSTCLIISTDNGTYRKGFFNITKYDLTNGVFAGIFDFTIYNTSSGCNDTIKITNGRFDIKL